MHGLSLQIHPDDNVRVALRDLPQGERVGEQGGAHFTLSEAIPAKHKFAIRELKAGAQIIMYGVPVGRAVTDIPRGFCLTTENVRHAAASYQLEAGKYVWTPPVVDRFADRHFMGYHRVDGRVGTRNYWLVFPLVFCENRNIKVMEQAMLEQLGYAGQASPVMDVSQLINLYQQGASVEDLLKAEVGLEGEMKKKPRLFPQVDGIKFLTHEGGCGGIRQDSETLCRLLAGYIANPNVAGATVLSLGCQNAQMADLQAALQALPSAAAKPVFFLEQQQSSSEKAFIAEAIKQTFVGLTLANQISRQPAPLSKLVLGLECGGSDGFSGITANPALGHASDLLVALGGTALLSEFPELNGVEQELIHRCREREQAEKFVRLMQAYHARAEAVGSGFDMNPSPGNIRDGLITDAMKSAGAAKKGGTSPIVDVLDYAEPVSRAGLNLLCTPGNDVESTTGLAGSGANLIVFTTGLGTPTGNPISPTVKFSSNTELYERMPDLIDLDAGTIISGLDSIASKGEALLEYLIEVASGRILTKAEILGQDDFIPWKRGISL